jgi:hypothetical protein
MARLRQEHLIVMREMVAREMVARFAEPRVEGEAMNRVEASAVRASRRSVTTHARCSIASSRWTSSAVVRT